MCKTLKSDFSTKVDTVVKISDLPTEKEIRVLNCDLILASIREKAESDVVLLFGIDLFLGEQRLGILSEKFLSSSAIISLYGRIFVLASFPELIYVLLVLLARFAQPVFQERVIAALTCQQVQQYGVYSITSGVKPSHELVKLYVSVISHRVLNRTLFLYIGR